MLVLRQIVINYVEIIPYFVLCSFEDYDSRAHFVKSVVPVISYSRVTQVKTVHLRL